MLRLIHWTGGEGTETRIRTNPDPPSDKSVSLTRYEVSHLCDDSCKDDAGTEYFGNVFAFGRTSMQVT